MPVCISLGARFYGKSAQSAQCMAMGKRESISGVSNEGCTKEYLIIILSNLWFAEVKTVNGLMAFEIRIYFCNNGLHTDCRLKGGGYA